MSLPFLKWHVLLRSRSTPCRLCYGMPRIATSRGDLNQASICPATHLQLGDVFFSVKDQRPPDAVGHQRHACRA